MSELSPREKRSIDELYSILAGYRREIDRIARAQDTRLTTLRAGDGAGLTFVDDDGKPLLQLGGRGAGVNGDLIKYLDGPVPEAPGEPLITGGAGVIHVTLGDGAEPTDAKLCRVHASLEADFEPSAGTMIGSVQPGHRSVSLSIQAGTWYCCVQWLTLSGKESEVSPVVSVEVDPMVDMSDLDDARAEADEKWAEFAEREQEYQDAIADAKARIEAAEEIFDLLPEPSDLETAVQQAQDAINTLGDVSQRLQDAEAALNESATRSDLDALDQQLTDAFSMELQSVLDALQGAGRTWSQATPPPAGVTYEWSDTPHQSESIKRFNGNELSRNRFINPSFEISTSGVTTFGPVDLSLSTWAPSVLQGGRYLNAVVTSDATGTTYVSQTASVVAGGYLSVVVPVRWRDGSRYARLYFTFRRSDGTTVSTVYPVPPTMLRNDFSEPLEATLQVPATATVALVRLQLLGADDTTTHPVAGTSIHTDGWQAVSAPTEEEAAQGIAEYFDGDSLDDRQNDLWITPSGQQHRWDVNTKSWVAFSNEQIQQAVDEALSKSDAALTMAGSKNSWLYGTTPPSFDGVVAGDYYSQRDAQRNIIGTWRWNGNVWQSEVLSDSVLGNVSVGKLVAGSANIHTAVLSKIWAELGVFDRLEAQSGWIGGTMLENGAVTADKITVTSQLITKILGVETAVADVLVANVELWARSATIIAATMGNLTVTEKANFVDAFADSFMSNSAIIRELLTSRLVVSAENFAPDPGKVPEVWDLIGADVVSNSNSATGNAIRLGQRSDDTRVRGPVRPVRPGDTIRFKGYYVRSGSGSSVGQPVQLRMEWFTDPKGNRTSWVTFHTVSATMWSHDVEAEVVVPDGVTWGRLYIYQATTTGPAVAQFYGDMDVRPMQGGELLVDGTLKTRKLDVDEIWANSTWQGEAHFGAEDATYRTLINGQGVEVYQKGETTDQGASEEVPVVQLGTGGDNAVSALVDGEVVGGIGQDGTVTGARVISADDALVAGYPVFGKLLHEEIPSRGDSWSLLDQLPRGVVASGSRNMNGVTWGGLGGQGFLELSFDGIWDRQYRLNIRPWQMSSDKNYFQRVVIRYDGEVPGITDTTGTGVQVWNTSAPFGGSYLLSPNSGTVRVLIGVYTGNNGLTYSSTLSNVHAWIEDIGSRVESSGLDRHSTLTYGSGGGETGGGNSGVTAKKSYHSAWHPSWMRSFMSGGGLYQTRGKGAAELRQGRDRYWTAGGIQTSAFGGFTSSAIAGETSRTISSALSGATLDSGSIELRGSYVPGGGSAVVRLHWHTLSSMPGSYTSTANHIGDYTITAGGSRRIALPAAVRTAIKNGSFGGFGLNPRGSTSQQYALGVSWSVRPTLRLKYTR